MTRTYLNLVVPHVSDNQLIVFIDTGEIRTGDELIGQELVVELVEDFSGRGIVNAHKILLCVGHHQITLQCDNLLNFEVGFYFHFNYVTLSKHLNFIQI